MNDPNTISARVAQTIAERDLAGPQTPVLLMVSGGSDSTALAYLACELNSTQLIGPFAMLHVNHCLRGADADADQAFVSDLAQLLGIPLAIHTADIAAQAKVTGENLEALGRKERYRAARTALEKLCQEQGIPSDQGRIFTAHTQDDRVESFFMRAIVGTGPGSFRSMRYRSGVVAHPLLDTSRQELRDFLAARADAGLPVLRDASGALWREDATNAHTDRFRAYVRHEIIPRARTRNEQLLDTLCRSMNLIADEDDMLDSMAADCEARTVIWLAEEVGARDGIDAEGRGNAGDGVDAGCVLAPEATAGCVLAPDFAREPLPMQRRVCMRVLKRLLGEKARIEAASVQALLAGFANGKPISGYTANIQGDLALSANKRGLRIEPMATYRARRKKR